MAAKTKSPAPESQPLFEEDLKALEQTVKRLEAEQIPLEESLSLFEEGISLAKRCAKTLDNAEQRILELTSDGKAEPASL